MAAASARYRDREFRVPDMHCFIEGAEWADTNPLNDWNKFSDENMPEKGDIVAIAFINEKFNIASYELMKFDPAIISRPYRDDVLWYPIPQL